MQVRPLPMLSGLRGPDAVATRQALFALQKQLPLLKQSSDGFPRPELGRQLVEEDTGRIFVSDGEDWIFLGPRSIFVREAPAAPSGGHNAVGAWSAGFASPFVGEAQISFNAVIDVDAVGRAGLCLVERTDNGGATVTTVGSARWHDSTEGENQGCSLTLTDKFEANQTTQYRLKFTVDGGSGSASIRVDSTVVVEYFGRLS